MRPIGVMAAVGAIAVLLGGTAEARGFGASGIHGSAGFHRSGSQFGGSHWGGSHWSGHASGTHSFRSAGVRRSHRVGGQHSASGNERSNRGGLRRGQERASYVHRLNNERRGAQETGGRHGDHDRTVTGNTGSGTRAAGASGNTNGTTSRAGDTASRATTGVTRIGSAAGRGIERDGNRD